jgi:hypothetical protein
MSQLQYTYTPYFCEENIYKLCQQLTGQQDYDGELFAVFISNEEKLVSPYLKRYHLFICVRARMLRERRKRKEASTFAQLGVPVIRLEMYRSK